VAVRSGRFQSSGSRFSPYHGCRAPPVNVAERPAAPLATHHDPRMRYRARAWVLERIQSGQRLGRGDELEPRAHAAEGVAERELAFGAVAHERALVHARFGRGREERREERGVRGRRRVARAGRGVRVHEARVVLEAVVPRELRKVESPAPGRAGAADDERGQREHPREWRGVVVHGRQRVHELREGEAAAVARAARRQARPGRRGGGTHSTPSLQSVLSAGHGERESL
jgi:hypothetical protein